MNADGDTLLGGSPHMTRTITTTYTIGKGTLVARKRRKAPADPAEIARKKAEREAHTRSTPSEWGINEDAQRLDQNGNVDRTEATREKTARVWRYDAFGILANRGGLGDGADANDVRLKAVRRFEITLAERMRLEGVQGAGVGGGRGIPISDRSLHARETLDFLKKAMTPMCWGLLNRLVEPSVINGQPSNNWRKVVEDFSGEHRHVHQARLVASVAADILSAWQAWDHRNKRAA
jgi:hypothetical protein